MNHPIREERCPRREIGGVLRRSVLTLKNGLATSFRGLGAQRATQENEMLLLYLGPEVVAPVLSAIAAIGGVLMMFWRRVVATARAIGRFITRRPKPEVRVEQDAIG